MDTKTVGAVVATVKNVENDGDGSEGNGEFEAVLSTEVADRQKESVAKGAFDPLPAEIPIHINHQFTDIKSIVGRGEPFYDGDTLKVKGRYASTPDAQLVRTLVAEGMLQTVSVGFLNAKRTPVDQKGIRTLQSAELIEASFVSVPANPEALVTASKALAPLPLRIGRTMSEFGPIATQGFAALAAATKAIAGSYEEAQEELRDALRSELHPDARWLWVRGTFDDHVVYEVESDAAADGYENTTYDVTYSRTAEEFTFGQPVEVDVDEIVSPAEGDNESTPETTSAEDAAKAASSPEGPSPAVAKARASATAARARLELLNP